MVYAFAYLTYSARSVRRMSPLRRNVSCMTMSVSAQGLERIISKIDLFRKEIVDIVRSDEGESMVCEMNIQFFPLSKEKTALPPETDKEGVE